MKGKKRNMNKQPTFLSASWDAWRAAREGEQGIARRQQERLRALVSYARTHSRYFADLYRGVPEQLTDVRQLPVVTKVEMMSHFDSWVTDPAVTEQQVEAFIADPSLIGHDYVDRYVVCTTSGSTGSPAILVHDHGALVVYNVLGYIAREQEAGRLQIHPVMVNAAGETLTDVVRQRVEAAFGCAVGNYYGSSEAIGLTYECRHKQLHVNSDWYIREPVDVQDGRSGDHQPRHLPLRKSIPGHTRYWSYR